MSTAAKWVKLGRLLYSFGKEGLGFFREVRSKNDLISTVCHTILVNRPVSEVIQFPENGFCSLRSGADPGGGMRVCIVLTSRFHLFFFL